MKVLKQSIQQSLLIGSIVMLVMLASDASASGRFRNRHQGVKGVADIRACNDGDNIRGRAFLQEQRSDQGVKKVNINVFLRGWDLPDGEHGIHIHEVANCEPCGDAGGHFDPGPNGNSSPDGNHPYHLGDLENIYVQNGAGQLRTMTTRVTLSDGPISIFDEDGSAFIIHVDSDTFCPDGEEAGCAGGGRLACGIIRRSR